MLKLATVIAATILAPLAAQAASSIVAIRACPYTISTPGRYKLTQDLICPAGDGITITADNVRLNLGGHTLTGSSLTIGINARGEPSDRITGLRIQQGTVKGFQVGVSILNAPGAWINGMTTTGNAGTGLSVRYAPGARVSVVTATGNGYNGIEVFDSPGGQIQGNIAKGDFSGLVTGTCDGCALVGNRAIGNRFEGIAVSNSTSARIVDSKATGNSIDLADEDRPACVNTWRHNHFDTDNEGDGPGKGCIQ